MRWRIPKCAGITAQTSANRQRSYQNKRVDNVACSGVRRKISWAGFHYYNFCIKSTN